MTLENDLSHWHTLDIQESVDKLQTHLTKGLDEEEVKTRRDQFGPNELAETGMRGPWSILWEQLKGPMVLLLFIAAAVSFYLEEYTDTVVIFVIVVLNAGLGFFQDFRAERALAALKKMTVPTIKVRRSGEVKQITSKELIPGDIMLLETGDIIPADCRMSESFNLQTQEAALTGESESVSKHANVLPENDLPLGDRKNMGFMGTVVSYGHGSAIVTAIGQQTELGKIATLLRSVQHELTPLQIRLVQLGKALAIAALVLVGIVFVLGILNNESPKHMILTALSLAVAAVPEGLPAVATITLALGAGRMLERQALIRKLPAVETLGSVTVICSDKTGTLTQNQMTVTELTDGTNSESLELDTPIAKQTELKHESLKKLLIVGALCNNSELQQEASTEKYQAIGEPTETALILAAAKYGMIKPTIESELPRVGEAPFDSERKCMTTIHQLNRANLSVGTSELLKRFSLSEKTDYLAFTKGAMDQLLVISRDVEQDGSKFTLDEDVREKIQTAHDKLAAKGMRILATAYQPHQTLPQAGHEQEVEQNTIFLGLIGMIDPPRPEVREAVTRCKSAGIRPIMITGDHPLTAVSIAKDLGICTDGEVKTGPELQRMDDQKLREVVQIVSIYARVSPEHKLRIVQALQENNQVVAMTGDGVNDAPALRKADIGVAMGITGTDVSKESADMVLLNDNFSTIVAAVEEGRVVYDNIRKFIKYTLTSNAGEIGVMLFAPFLGMPLPLVPLQILWVNLVTDGLPGLAMAVEPAEPDTMNRPPHAPNAHILGGGMIWDILWVGLLMSVVSLFVGYWYWLPTLTENSSDEANIYWRTMVFTVVTLSQMGNALAIRSTRESIFKIGLFSNHMMLWAISLTLLLQLMVIYVPFFQDIFATTALTFVDLMICFVMSSILFGAVELQKYFLRKKSLA